ncbi:MAG: S8 family peptidase [Lysobacteraceae bacterium]
MSLHRRSLHTRSLRRLALASATAAALLAAPAFAAGRVDLDPASRYDPADGFIVGYRSAGFLKADPASRQRALDAASTATFGRTAAPGLRRTRTLSGGGELVTFDRRLGRADAERLMRRLALDPDVAYVEPNLRLHADLTPNDTYFSLQTNFASSGENTYATQAWDTGYLGQGKTIAVIDTGITSHPDLAANVLAGGDDFISNAAIANDGGGRDADPSDPGDWVTAGFCYGGSPASNSSWHGTHVAGTAAAVTNNGVGVAGMAFGARILPVRVLGRCGGTLADIADAVTWASGGTVAGVPAVGANRANVINLSLGGAGACGATMQSAIDGAVSRGTVVVVAAGNDNADVAGYTPASCNNVIVVATFNHLGSFYGQKESFSNYGNGVDLAAPGYSIASTWNAGTTVPGAAAYAYLSGTSMSTPHVAGVIAMMMSRPSADCLPAACENIVKTGTDYFMGPVQYPIGWGRLNALKAINATP